MMYQNLAIDRYWFVWRFSWYENKFFNRRIYNFRNKIWIL